MNTVIAMMPPTEHPDDLADIVLSPRSVCEFELLATGALNPVRNFMSREDAERVAAEGRLTSGEAFPVPITLPVDNPVPPGTRLLLRDSENLRLGILHVEDCFHRWNLSGPLEVIELPRRAGFAELRQSAPNTKAMWSETPVLGVMLRSLPDLPLEEEFRRWKGKKLAVVAAGEGDVFPLVRSARYLDADIRLAPVPNWGRHQDAVDEVILRNYGATEVLAWCGGGELRPEVAALAQASQNSRGFCVWFTGLPSSGKSTSAKALSALLEERGRRVTLLDGDVVRRHLSRGLGFSREDRDANVLRIGFVAAEIVRHGGAVICAAVSPYADTRSQVREMVGAGQFIEVHMDTPQPVCEARDEKGFYAKARAGLLSNFTGVDDPYDPPVSPEVRLTTTTKTVEDNVRILIQHLELAGFLSR